MKSSPAILVSIGLSLTSLTVSAQSGITARVIAQRTAEAQEARNLITEASVLGAAHNHEEASHLYRQALDLLPPAGMTERDRVAAVSGYEFHAIKYAEELNAKGDVERAKGLVEDVLSPAVDPAYAPALALQKDFGDPAVTPIASTPLHRERVQKVVKLLGFAHSAMDEARYDEADELFKSVLRLDSYNTAARRGMEELEKHRKQYADAARDHTRAAMLSAVSAQWESPVPAKISLGTVTGGQVDSSNGTALTERKLHSIILPKISLTDTTIADAVDFLNKKAREADPSKEGVNIILHPGVKNVPVNLVLDQLPLAEVLRYTAEIVGARVRLEPFGVSLVPMNSADDKLQLISRTYQVSSTFMDRQGDAAPKEDTPFGNAGGDASIRGLTVKKLTAKEVLTNFGVTWPEGSSVSYSDGTLSVVNSVANLDLIDNVVEQARGLDPRQIGIYVKMIDVTQENVHELGFDWLLGASSLGSGVALGGGAYGMQAPNYQPSDWGNANGTPITSGNRGASSLNTNTTIEELIRNGQQITGGVDLKSPGVFQVAGILTAPQFEVMMRGLNQKKGVDRLAEPSVVVRPSQRATIDMVREFIYPIEFEPPEIPQSVDNTNYQTALDPITGLPILTTSQRASTPVTPTTPTAFETRNTGISLEVEPVIAPDGKTVSLTVSASSVEFEGFIDYGSPITDGQLALTPNSLPQPIFRTNHITAPVDVYDGGTIMLGGMISDTSRMIDDKTPILGDLPLIGRFFQSQAQSTSKRYVVFFVTVRLIDPAGATVRPTEDQIEDLPYPSAPPPLPPPPPFISK